MVSVTIGRFSQILSQILQGRLSLPVAGGLQGTGLGGPRESTDSIESLDGGRQAGLTSCAIPQGFAFPRTSS